MKENSQLNDVETNYLPFKILREKGWLPGLSAYLCGFVPAKNQAFNATFYVALKIHVALR